MTCPAWTMWTHYSKCAATVKFTSSIGWQIYQILLRWYIGWYIRLKSSPLCHGQVSMLSTHCDNLSLPKSLPPQFTAFHPATLWNIPNNFLPNKLCFWNFIPTDIHKQCLAVGLLGNIIDLVIPSLISGVFPLAYANHLSIPLLKK